MVRKTITLLAIACLLLGFICCKEGIGGRMPSSTGQPYEVVLEGDTDSILTKVLTEDVPALPQPEPMFNIIQIKKDKAKGSYLMVRTRIIVDVDSRNKGYAVERNKDVNASPQTVLHIKAQSTEQLKNKLDGEKLRVLIDKEELRHLASVIQQNPEKQREVKQLFGIDMKISASMNASKKGKDFRWYSNNAIAGMQNLLIFKVRIFPHIPQAMLKSKIDSVLRKNIPGETDGMYMQLTNLGERGLWEMKGDAMGGPYVMRTIRSTTGDDAIVVIGFVYAPEMKKRNLIKQLEATLLTIHKK